VNQAQLLGRTMGRLYNCAHFASELWEHETGRDIRMLLAGFLAVPSERRAAPQVAHDFRRLTGPESPCIVLLRRVRATPHVGVFVRGRVAHLTEVGPIRQPLSIAQLGFTSVRFYAPR
jgi:hypothetical protein